MREFLEYVVQRYAEGGGAPRGGYPWDQSKEVEEDEDGYPVEWRTKGRRGRRSASWMEEHGEEYEEVLGEEEEDEEDEEYSY
jgi:hypothetical protein